MGQVKILCLHCTDTPSWLDIEVSDIEQWHMSPRDLKDGRVRYLGVTYPNRDYLPEDRINGVLVKYLHGRGWDRKGYADMLKRGGKIVNVTPYDDDDWISNKEMTWGASGINAISRHIVLEGGRGAHKEDSFFDNYTTEMFMSLTEYCYDFITHYPDAVIIGHDKVSSKECPGFDVREFLDWIGLDKYYGNDIKK